MQDEAMSQGGKITAQSNMKTNILVHCACYCECGLVFRCKVLLFTVI